EIFVEEQNKRGIKPNQRSVADKIMVKNCRMSVAREGANVGLFDYLVKNVEFNESNSDILPEARPIYKIIDLNKIDEVENENAMLQNEAMSFVFGLQTKRGDIYVYQEDRINNLCELFSVFAETFPKKVKLLADNAKLYPVDFM